MWNRCGISGIPGTTEIVWKTYRITWHTLLCDAAFQTSHVILSVCSSNRYSTPSAHHLQLVTTNIPHRLHITYSLLQPVYHTAYTSHTRYIKTNHITAPSITPNTPNNFNSQDFNFYSFLTYIYITYIILTEIIIIFNCYGVTAIQLTFVSLSFCNNITLKMALIAAETCWWEKRK